MRDETFCVDRRGALVRMVTPRRGKSYEHRCTADSFERVAHAIDEAAAAGFTLEELADAEGLPSTQVATALAFLKERGCVFVEARRVYPASTGVHLDAMTEYHALRQSPSG